MAWFAWRASTVKRGKVLRLSPLSKMVWSSIGAGEEAPSQRAVGHKADAQLLTDREHLLLRAAPPQRVLALDGGHRLDGVGTADRLCGGLGQAEVLDLALVDQVFDRAGDLLYGHVGVDPVLVEQVDSLDAQAGQGCVCGLLDQLGPARTDMLAGGVDLPELRGHDHLVTDGRRARRPRAVRS